MIRNQRENREIRKKTANKAALRKARSLAQCGFVGGRRIGAIIGVAIDANATVALTNRKEA